MSLKPIPMVTPEEVRKKIRAGEDILLVCSHENEEECKDDMPEEVIPLSEFMSVIPSLPSYQEIIFFSDSSTEKIAIERAEKLKDLGFKNVKVLEGGFSAWHGFIKNRKRRA